MTDRISKSTMGQIKSMSTGESFRQGRSYYENDMILSSEIIDNSTHAVISGENDYYVIIFSGCKR